MFVVERLIRSNLDGSDSSTILQIGKCFHLTVDKHHDQLYWIGDRDGFYRSNLDGSEVKHLNYRLPEYWSFIRIHMVDQKYVYFTINYITLPRRNTEFLRRVDKFTGAFDEKFGIDLKDKNMYYPGIKPVQFVVNLDEENNQNKIYDSASDPSPRVTMV